MKNKPLTTQELLKLKSILNNSLNFIENMIKDDRDNNIENFLEIKENFLFFLNLISFQIKNKKERKSKEESPNKEIYSLLKDVAFICKN